MRKNNAQYKRDRDTRFLHESPNQIKRTTERREIHYNSHVTGITGVVCQSLSVGLS